MKFGSQVLLSWLIMILNSKLRNSKFRTKMQKWPNLDKIWHWNVFKFVDYKFQLKIQKFKTPDQILKVVLIWIKIGTWGHFNYESMNLFDYESKFKFRNWKFWTKFWKLIWFGWRLALKCFDLADYKPKLKIQKSKGLVKLQKVF